MVADLGVDAAAAAAGFEAQKAAGSHKLDQLLCQTEFLELGRLDVQWLVRSDELTPPDVAGMMVRVATATQENVRVPGLLKSRARSGG